MGGTQDVAILNRSMYIFLSPHSHSCLHSVLSIRGTWVAAGYPDCGRCRCRNGREFSRTVNRDRRGLTHWYHLLMLSTCGTWAAGSHPDCACCMHRNGGEFGRTVDRLLHNQRGLTHWYRLPVSSTRGMWAASSHPHRTNRQMVPQLHHHG